MNVLPANQPLKMARANLDGGPVFPLPAGYSVRWYEPGDEAHWRDIHLAAERFIEITPGLFAEQFGRGGERGLPPAVAGGKRCGIESGLHGKTSALQDLRERQGYLVEPGGEVIGTGTAWFGEAGAKVLGEARRSGTRPEEEAILREEESRAAPLNRSGVSGERRKTLPPELAALCRDAATPSSMERGLMNARWGRVHWMAIRPEFQGRGLGRALLTVICRRLRELGHERAYLHTSAARLAAIRLYLGFGFEPVLRNAEEETVWKAVLAGLA